MTAQWRALAEAATEVQLDGRAGVLQKPFDICSLVEAAAMDMIGLPCFWQRLVRLESASSTSGNFWRGSNRPRLLVRNQGFGA